MPPPVISEVYAGFHVICWLHFVRERGRGRKRGKREGKEIVKGEGKGMLKGWGWWKERGCECDG